MLIFFQGKKFAKPELKSSIEDFEEKIIKLHNEKKEQVLTEKNAQAHKQKVDRLEISMVIKKDVEESGESEVTEGRYINCIHIYSRSIFSSNWGVYRVVPRLNAGLGCKIG